jgi:hypothetical protein
VGQGGQVLGREAGLICSAGRIFRNARSANTDERLKKTHDPTGTAGRVNRNTAPRGSLASAHSRPPWALMMERQIDSPIPMPLDFVV